MSHMQLERAGSFRYFKFLCGGGSRNILSQAYSTGRPVSMLDADSSLTRLDCHVKISFNIFHKYYKINRVILVDRFFTRRTVKIKLPTPGELNIRNIWIKA